MDFDLCSIGGLINLTILDITSFPVPGETAFVTGTQKYVGNDAAIVSIMASQMGLETQLRSNPICPNDGGLHLLKLLKANQVNYDYISLSGNRTPVNYCLREPNRIRTWLPEINIGFPDVLSQPLIKAKFVYMDLYEEAISIRLNTLAHLIENNLATYVNLSASSISEKLQYLEGIQGIEVIQVSMSVNLHEATEFARYIFEKLSAMTVVVTLGSIGSVMYNEQGPNQFLVQKSDKNVINTLGAGATFASGFIYALVNGHSYKESHEIASRKAVEFCYSQKNPVEL